MLFASLFIGHAVGAETFEVGGGGGKGGGRAQRGGAIVGSSGEALRPLDTATTFHPDKFPLFSGVFGLQPP